MNGPHVRKTPPKKRPGQALGRRLHTGALKDVAGLALELGITEGELRARVARGQIPFRKWSGRIIFLADEIRDYLRALPGVTLEQALENTQRGSAS